MGNLKPGATYIYERDKGVTYARELGSDPDSRQPIGWDYNDDVYKAIANNYFDSMLWKNIFEEAKTNHTLQQAIERVIILYKLSKDKLE